MERTDRLAHPGPTQRGAASAPVRRPTPAPSKGTLAGQRAYQLPPMRRSAWPSGASRPARSDRPASLGLVEVDRDLDARALAGHGERLGQVLDVQAVRDQP